jgi:hypothetical protein
VTADTEPPTLCASYTFTFSQLNFTTFRLKLSPSTNTSLLFSRDADIRYTLTTSYPLRWITPLEQDHVILFEDEGAETYLLITPGEKLLREIVSRRRKLRSFDCVEKMEVPDEVLIEFCQGLMVPENEKRKEFMWMMEWDF